MSTTENFMRPPLRRFLYLLVLAALTLAPATLAAEGISRIPSELLGAWKSQEGADLVRFETDRMLQSTGGHLKVRGFVQSAPGKLTLRAGALDLWGYSVHGTELTLRHQDSSQAYTRLSAVPPELELKPMPLGTPGTVEPAKLEEIRKDLSVRVKKDQSVRTDPAQAPKMAEMDSDNRRYLRSLVSEIGWIDVDRFGPRASTDAFLLVQHSGDLGLMMAALPMIEKDAKRFPDYAQPYTLLYDRVQIDLGRKQRYGTQLHTDAAGNPAVLPLEDPAHVDEYLKDLKLPPLSEYLATASKYLYDNKPIRMPNKDE
jgi:hypothetical protein